MLIKDAHGNGLLEVIEGEEERVEECYQPITHALVVVKVGDDYLLGYNHWRKNWEIFGGCKEEGETLRECIIREGAEELGLCDVEYTWIGLMHFHMMPDYFSAKEREEYGGLYGVSLPAEYLNQIERSRADKTEIEKVQLYCKLDKSEKIAAIDEKLLKFWRE